MEFLDKIIFFVCVINIFIAGLNIGILIERYRKDKMVIKGKSESNVIKIDSEE